MNPYSGHECCPTGRVQRCALNSQYNTAIVMHRTRSNGYVYQPIRETNVAQQVINVRQQCGIWVVDAVLVNVCIVMTENNRLETMPTHDSGVPITERILIFEVNIAVIQPLRQVTLSERHPPRGDIAWLAEFPELELAA